MTTPLIDVSTLATPLTAEQVKKQIYAAMAAVGLSTTSWKPLGMSRTIVAVIAAVLAGYTRVVSVLVRSTLLDLADGDGLTVLAYYVYGVLRILATQATGDVVLTNAGGGVYDVDPGDLVVRNVDTNALYSNVSAFHLGALGTATVTVRALEAGSAGSALATKITQFSTPLLGVTVSNPAALLAVDEELDEPLRVRCRESLGALSPNGPREAYAYVAKSAVRADGTSVGVNRVSTTVSSPTAEVGVLVATPSGAVPGTLGDASTDLGLVEKLVLELVEPLGVTATLDTATNITVAVTSDVYIRTSSNLTDLEVQTAVEAQLVRFFQTVPIGGFPGGLLFVDGLRGEVRVAVPLAYHATISAPASDVAIAADQVAVPGVITTNVHRVA